MTRSEVDAIEAKLKARDEELQQNVRNWNAGVLKEDRDKEKAEKEQEVLRQAELRKNFRSHAWRLKNLYHIRQKDGTVALFKPNEAQEAYLAQESRRDIILKARQLGFSTLKLLQLLDRTIFFPNTTSVIIAHHKDTLEKLFRIVKFAYDNYPKEFPKPAAKYDNKYELFFPEMNSTIYVALSVRGDSVNNLHVSELAFMEDAENRLVSCLAALVPNGRITIESTANGVGNYFYDFYVSAVERGFKSFFFPWSLAKEYRMPVDGVVFSAEEEKFRLKHGLEPEQLCWYKQNKALFRDKFPEVYPINAEEAFLASGNNVFPVARLNELQTVPPIESSDTAQIWVRPRHGRIYAIGVDTAEGTGHDEHSIDVIDTGTGEQVAHWSGKCPMQVLAERISQLCSMYNRALIIPEANNHGFALIFMLSEMKLPIYKREKFDAGKTERQSKLGWLTTARTKAMMIGALVKAVHEDDVVIHSAKTIAQMKTYLYLEDGTMGAAPGKWDDTVMSMALALQGFRQLPRRHQPESAKPEGMALPYVQTAY